MHSCKVFKQGRVGGLVGGQILSRTSFVFLAYSFCPFPSENKLLLLFSFLRLCTCASVQRPCATWTSSLQGIRSLQPLQTHPQQTQVSKSDNLSSSGFNFIGYSFKTIFLSGGWWDSTTAAQGGAESVQPTFFILSSLLLFYSLF